MIIYYLLSTHNNKEFRNQELLLEFDFLDKLVSRVSPDTRQGLNGNTSYSYQFDEISSQNLVVRDSLPLAERLLPMNCLRVAFVAPVNYL